MKNTCPVCGAGKARRECLRKDGSTICSRCCAEMRGTECSGCTYYEETLLHAMRRGAGLPNGHFIAEVNPEVQEAMNEVLDRAMAGEKGTAFQEMERLLAENPRNHDVCYGMGCLFAISGKNAEAIPWFEKAISIFPYMGEAHFNLAIAYQRTGKIGRMITAFRNAVKCGDPQEEYHQTARSQLETAKTAIRRNEGVDLDSYVASSEKFDAAFDLMENHQWEAALKGFRAAARRNEKNAPTHGNMGLCLAQLGRKAEALAAFDRAIEINPKYEPAIRNRVLVEHMQEGIPLAGVGYESINFFEEQLEKRRRSSSGA